MPPCLKGHYLPKSDMFDALIKRVSVTYKCYEMYVHRGEKRCNCSCFEIDQVMDAILLIIGIVYGQKFTILSDNARLR
jgi:hypothetical protein